MKRTGIFIVVGVIALSGASFAVQRSKSPELKEKNLTLKEPAVPVSVCSVVSREFQEEIGAVCTLKAHRTALISAKVAGNVDEVLADIGESVRENQVVILIDRTLFDLAVSQAEAAFSASESAVLQAHAQFEYAKKESRRASNLLAEKVIAQGRCEQAEAACNTAREALALAMGKRDQAKAALETARQHLKETEILSPVFGTIVERNVEIGQSVAPGATLLRTLDQSRLRADVEMKESDFGRVAVGVQAFIHVDAISGEQFSGEVTRINPMVDGQTRTFKVRIEIPNLEGRLVDGMFARVRFSLGHRKALAVHKDALQRLPGSGTFYVYVVNEDRVVKKIVQVGFIGDQYAEILDGLVQGQTVVTWGQGRLRSGANVIWTQKTSPE